MCQHIVGTYTRIEIIISVFSLYFIDDFGWMAYLNKPIRLSALHQISLF